MNKNLLFSLWLTLFTLFSSVAWGQDYYKMSLGNYFEDFSALDEWTNNYASGTGANYWKVVTNSVFATGTAGGVQKGDQQLVLLATGSNTTSTDLLMDFSDVKPLRIKFNWYKVVNSQSSNRNGKLVVQYSTNGTTFNSLPNYVNPVYDNSTTVQSGVVDLQLPASLADQSKVTFRFVVNRNNANGSGNNPKVAIDDISITAEPIVQPSTITSNPTSLEPFAHIIDEGPSTVQSFNLLGENLDGSEIELAVADGFELSKTGNTNEFSTTLIYPETSSTFNERVYIRYNGSAIGNISSSITVIGGGAELEIPLTGSVIMQTTVKPTISVLETAVSINTYIGNATISLSTITEDALIYYTIDGTIPTEQSLLYTAPFEVTTSTTIKALAIKEGMTNSAIAEQLITIVNTSLSQSAQLTSFLNYYRQGEFEVQRFNLTGQYLDGSPIDLIVDNGFEISLNGEEYLQEIVIEGGNASLNQEIFVRFRGEEIGLYETAILIFGGGAELEIALRGDVVKRVVAAPVISITENTISSDTYQNVATVSLTTATEDATIYYTTNGDEPTEESAIYESAFTVATSSVIKAIAVKEDMINSELVTKSLTIKPSTPNATAATLITHNSFQANWDNVLNADGYEVEVYKKVSSAPLELVVNGDFDDELINWNFESNLSESVIDNVLNINATHTSSNREFYQNINNLEIDKTYQLKFKYFIETNSLDEAFRVWTTSGVSTDIKLPTSTTYYGTSKGEWIEVTHNFKAIMNVVKLTFRVYKGAKFKIDDISVMLAEAEVTRMRIQGSPFSANTNSLVIDGLEPEATYEYSVVAKNGLEVSTASNAIEVTTLKDKAIWENGYWSNMPEIDRDAIVKSDGFGSFSAKSLKFETDVEIPSGVTLTVENEVDNSLHHAVTFQPGAYLIQNSNATNIGDVTYQAQSQVMYRNDMSIWSSPVQGQKIRAFSPETLANRFWWYDEPTTNYLPLFIEDPTDVDFEPAKGIAIRVRNTLPTGSTEAKIGAFTGVLNNGNYSISATKTVNGYNLVGNPYPSNIDVDKFFLMNPDVEQIFIWTPHYRTSDPLFGNNYITINRAGASGIIEGDIRTIAAGQGFFVQVNDGTTILFDNSLRTAEAGTFRRVENNRYWLSLTKDGITTNRILVSHRDGATVEEDHQYDAKSVEEGSTKIYTKIGAANYSIQSRPFPLVENERIPLGITTNTAGEMTIALENAEGIFAEVQEVLVEDKALNVIHNLSEAPYVFTANVGITDDRFEIIYVNRTLATTEIERTGVKVYQHLHKTVIEAENRMLAVKVYDALGRQVLVQKNIDSTKTELQLPKGVFYLSVELDNQTTVAEKVFIK